MAFPITEKGLAETIENVFLGTAFGPKKEKVMEVLRNLH
jgi:hypothetical protein